MGADAAAQSEAGPASEKLDAAAVEAERDGLAEPPVPRALSFLSRTQASGAGPPTLPFNVMDAMVVTATRSPLEVERVGVSLKLLDAETLRQAPTATLDGALRSVPGFSLFRRSDSFTANPTAQGVSLRGLGPSGASRSLVLLDGVPLNDPFGGWVAWTKLPREGMGRAEIVPGGGATAWGNAALGGVVHLFSAPVRTTLSVIEQPPGPIEWASTGSLRFATILGDFGTRSAEVALVVPMAAGTLQLLGRQFTTDGFRVVAPEHRGPIDVPAWSRHRWLTARWRQTLGQKTELLATARVFDEQRGNGTPYQGNDSREKFVSLALAGEVSSRFAWDAVAYAQDQTYASAFSAVNATRSAETPASDQFAVPATAFGAAWIGAWRHGSEARTNFGVDTRFVRGETREHYFFANGDFTRLRVAGGRQFIMGAFALHEQALTENLRATVGVRLDSWRDTDGHRYEADRATGVRSRDERYRDRDGTSVSPSASLLWTPGERWRWRASAQQGFRRPTLNELYRPFRIGPTITEANAGLGTESVRGFEFGAEWRLPAPAPALVARRNSAGSTAVPRLALGATAFTNELRDAVGNVTLVRGPGSYPLFGFIGAGGVGRQRLNLERMRVRGVELSARWAPTSTLRVTSEYLLSDATIRRSTLAPGLEGLRVAQVPRHSAILGAIWRGPAAVTVAPRVRWIGRQFEDDENQLRLGEVVVADLSLSRRLTRNLELFLTVENLGNARIETGRNAGGLVNTGMPRFVLGGLRGTW